MKSVHWCIATEPLPRQNFLKMSTPKKIPIKGVKKSYPSAELQVSLIDDQLFNITNYKVICCLAASKDTRSDLELSPHSLVSLADWTNGGRAMRSFHVIDAELQYATDFVYKYKFTLKNYGIVKCKFEDRLIALEEKYDEYKNLGLPQKLQEKLERKAEKRLEKIDKVYLCFVLVNQTTLETKITFSKSILDLAPIHINMVCPSRVPIDGPESGNGSIIVLLVSDVARNYTLEIIDIDGPTTTNYWRKRVKPMDVCRANKALIYELPKYEWPNAENDEQFNVTCKIRLSSGRCRSNEVPIIYENNSFLRKRHAIPCEVNEASAITVRFGTDEEKMLGGHKIVRYMTDGNL